MTIYTSQIIPKCMYVTCTWQEQWRERFGNDFGRTDTTGHFTPQTGTSPSRVNSVKPRTGRERHPLRFCPKCTHVQQFNEQLRSELGCQDPAKPELYSLYCFDVGTRCFHNGNTSGRKPHGGCCCRERTLSKKSFSCNGGLTIFVANFCCKPVFFLGPC